MSESPLNQLSIAQTLPVLEPLSQATEQTLEPITLFQNDYLEIDLGEETQKTKKESGIKLVFVTQAMALRPFRPGLDEGKPIITTASGEQMVKDDRGPSASAASRWQKRIPERKELGYGRWLFATTDFTALVIHHVWPAERLIFKTPDARLQYEFLLARFLSQTKSAQIVADFKLNGKLPALPADFIEHPDMPLTDYQKCALACSIGQEGYALFKEQGLGKTAVVIARVCLEGRRKFEGRLAGVNKGMYRALIMCPRSVRINWQNEFERFATTPGKTAVLRGGQVDRVKCLVEGVRSEPDCCWSACIISIDSVESTFQALKKVPWDLVVIDESHWIKGYWTKRFKCVRQFATLPNVRQRMCLTGTPIPNSVMDIWGQLEFLGEGLSGFSSFSAFRSFHGSFKRVDAGGSSISKLVGIKAIPLLQERLARVAFMLRKDEKINGQPVLGLPDKVYDIYEVEMTPRQAEYYKKLSTELALEIEEMLSEMESGSLRITVDHVLTMLLRLAQITSGHIKWDAEIDPITGEERGGRVEQISGGNPKVDAIVEMLKSEDRDPLGKTIVWCHFVEDIRVVSERLHLEGINHVGYHASIHQQYRARNAEEAADLFNKDRECRVFLGNPASGGTGLNIIGYDPKDPEASPTYCDHEIFMSCDWNAAKRSQAEDRAHRRGTRMPVKITDLVIPGTIDEDIRARVLAKRQTALLIQDVRDILRRILGKH